MSEIDHLIADLSSTDEEKRYIAREELSLHMDDQVAQSILALAASEADADARADALIALGPLVDECGIDYSGDEDDDDLEIGQPDFSRETFETVVSRLRQIYSNEREAKIVRRRAFEVLVRDPQPWQRGEIRQRFASDDDEWRRTAVFAMGYVDGFDGEIAATVAAADGPLLFEAVRAAGRSEVKAAAGRIRDLALDEDADPDLRIEAILALPNVDRYAAGLLEDLAESDDDDIAEAAEEALEELRLWERLDGEE